MATNPQLPQASRTRGAAAGLRRHARHRPGRGRTRSTTTRTRTRDDHADLRGVPRGLRRSLAASGYPMARTPRRRGRTSTGGGSTTRRRRTRWRDRIDAVPGAVERHAPPPPADDHAASARQNRMPGGAPAARSCGEYRVTERARPHGAHRHLRRDLPGRAAGQVVRRDPRARDPLPPALGLARASRGVRHPDGSSPWPRASCSRCCRASSCSAPPRCCSPSGPRADPRRAAGARRGGRPRRPRRPRRSRPGRSPGAHGLRAFATTFAVIFTAEWGDLTQLVTAGQAARTGESLSVFLGAWAALIAGRGHRRAGRRLAAAAGAAVADPAGVGRAAGAARRADRRRARPRLTPDTSNGPPPRGRAVRRVRFRYRRCAVIESRRRIGSGDTPADSRAGQPRGAPVRRRGNPPASCPRVALTTPTRVGWARKMIGRHRRGMQRRPITMTVSRRGPSINPVRRHLPSL